MDISDKLQRILIFTQHLLTISFSRINRTSRLISQIYLEDYNNCSIDRPEIDGVDQRLNVARRSFKFRS
jgi:hypothetical protein